MNFEKVKESLIEKKILEKDIIDIILVGSRLYNIHSEDSDYDYIVITSKKEVNGNSINKHNLNITIFSKEAYEKSLEEQKMLVLESFFAEKKFKYKNYNHFKFILNKELLLFNTRVNTIETLKRAVKTENYSLAKKRFFHAIRINSFKDQLLNSGKIFNFQENFAIWNELKLNYDNNLKYLLKKYKDWLK